MASRAARTEKNPFGGSEPVADEHGDERPVGEEKPETVYGSAEEFLHDQLLPCYLRDVDGKKAIWCANWYLHPEAISRITALWRAWEALRLEADTGMSIWWIQHADPTMYVLLSTDGPFFNCAGSHRAPKPMHYELAPAGWFPDERLDTSR
ncbi:DUF4913 domain-containing protein [Arthrobacter echini]|uniref:DUF4913 domain-containing protein n=1 Tax=Arthrobacter echini TaxID=1529066 RepID=A0A5D0XJD0_9MICC|nr:DUF4913 domain-containing protein [Arthrobacter echini]